MYSFDIVFSACIHVEITLILISIVNLISILIEYQFLVSNWLPSKDKDLYLQYCFNMRSRKIIFIVICSITFEIYSLVLTVPITIKTH